MGFGFRADVRSAIDYSPDSCPDLLRLGGIDLVGILAHGWDWGAAVPVGSTTEYEIES